MKYARRTLIALVLSLATWRAEAQPGTEEPGTHGMLVLGSGTVYVSHLPMFMPQHRYQGIWEVSFGEEGDKVYRAERARPENAKLIFTLEPQEEFLLPELTKTRKSFRADIYRGHFERPGHERILENVKVTIREQVHWHPFRNSHERPEPLTYLLFGKGNELFLAHWISLAPNYDQIVSVTSSKPLGEIPEGAQLVLAKRSDGDALKAGESVSGMMIAGLPEQPFTVKPVDLKVGSVIYLEKGELAKSTLADEE
ncbi:MAG: hypothetical protein QOH06_6101 [Acidobacteriota bacterium]|jgi:hypothetical protein|nr:hypothetical protein [Acidobacteriota bacterium]